MNDIIVVTGVSCGGKDYLLDKVNPPVKVVNFGEELFKTFNTKLFNKDQLGTLDYMTIERPVAKLTTKILKRKKFILNTHVVFRTKYGLTSKQEPMEKINPKGYVHISAPVLEIRQRRLERNPSVKQETIAQIAKHQALSREVTKELAKKNGAFYKNIWNRKDRLDSSVRLLSKALSIITNE